MALPIPSSRRIGVVLALAGATVSLGSAPVGAEPATPSIARGMPRIVDDVLGLQNPGFSGTPKFREPAF
ncbi:hypothetical protein M2284_004775 [Rhodococcus sp. LBL1]|nr:hypothetical protein [Rhodococcus sp. LBL1]MDH6686133.1 hypothetical protein [Rhodococcus sp. LBL2]